MELPTDQRLPTAMEPPDAIDNVSMEKSQLSSVLSSQEELPDIIKTDNEPPPEGEIPTNDDTNYDQAEIFLSPKCNKDLTETDTDHIQPPGEVEEDTQLVAQIETVGQESSESDAEAEMQIPLAELVDNGSVLIWWKLEVIQA